MVFLGDVSWDPDVGDPVVILSLSKDELTVG